jgi:hypothetical protein
MYCPQCAAQNVDGAKFCRSCGLKLESVALALKEESKPPSKKKKNQQSEPQTAQDWMEKRIKGIKEITGGMILLLVSLLLGVAMALFVPHEVPWILVWVVFFGWMACWGGIELANGIGNFLESKSRLRMLELESNETPIDLTPQQLSPAREPRTIDNRAFGLPPSLSVTEGTTRQLNERSKD